jgi:Ala-tRNA(Pro) deacylase
MPATAQDLFCRLDALGIAYRTLEHEAVFTVAESAKIERALPGGHTKNLFLKGKRDELYLVVAEGRSQVDLKSLHKKLGCARLSFAGAELLMEVLGVTPGSVTVFALINDIDARVKVVVDRALMTYDSINGHPLVNTATTNIARDDLLRFIRATGHEPQVLALGPGDDMTLA